MQRQSASTGPRDSSPEVHTQGTEVTPLTGASFSLHAQNIILNKNLCDNNNFFLPTSLWELLEISLENMLLNNGPHRIMVPMLRKEG